MLTATLLVAALLLSVLSFGAVTDSASAQYDPDVPDRSVQVCVNYTIRADGTCVFGGTPTCPYNAAITDGECAPAIAYPGPFTNMPTTPGGPYGWGSLHPVAGAVATPDAGAGGTGGGLAHTGSESTVLAYAGAGLIAFGAVALGSRRKFFQGALED